LQSLGGGGLRGVYLRDVLAEDVKFNSFSHILGCVFEHVTLRGRINRLLINSKFLHSSNAEAFEQSAKLEYQAIDWALDISELDCPDLDIRGIPARLIRRDPAVHSVVTYDTAYRLSLDEISQSIEGFRNSAHYFAISGLLDNKWEDVVLVAARRGKRAQEQQDMLAALREAGLATD
jgi:hypothetical protein